MAGEGVRTAFTQEDINFACIAEDVIESLYEASLEIDGTAGRGYSLLNHVLMVTVAKTQIENGMAADQKATYMQAAETAWEFAVTREAQLAAKDGHQA